MNCSKCNVKDNNLVSYCFCNNIDSLKVNSGLFLSNNLKYNLVDNISRVYDICKSLNNHLVSLNYITNDMLIYKTIIENYYENEIFLINDDLLKSNDSDLFNKYKSFVLIGDFV